MTFEPGSGLDSYRPARILSPGSQGHGRGDPARSGRCRQGRGEPAGTRRCATPAGAWSRSICARQESSRCRTKPSAGRRIITRPSGRCGSADRCWGNGYGTCASCSTPSTQSTRACRMRGGDRQRPGGPRRPQRRGRRPAHHARCGRRYARQLHQRRSLPGTTAGRDGPRHPARSRRRATPGRPVRSAPAW